MHKVVVLHLQQINHKQVVGNKLNILLALLPLLIFLRLDAVDTAVLAVVVPSGWRRAGKGWRYG